MGSPMAPRPMKPSSIGTSVYRSTSRGQSRTVSELREPSAVPASSSSTMASVSPQVAPAGQRVEGEGRRAPGSGRRSAPPRRSSPGPPRGGGGARRRAAGTRATSRPRTPSSSTTHIDSTTASAGRSGHCPVLGMLTGSSRRVPVTSESMTGPPARPSATSASCFAPRPARRPPRPCTRPGAPLAGRWG